MSLILLCCKKHTLMKMMKAWKGFGKKNGKNSSSPEDANSREVCILFRKTLEAEIHSKITDKEGRYIILDITF